MTEDTKSVDLYYPPQDPKDLWYRIAYFEDELAVLKKRYGIVNVPDGTPCPLCGKTHG